MNEEAAARVGPQPQQQQQQQQKKNPSVKDFQVINQEMLNGFPN